MRNPKNLLIAAAVTGALAALPMTARADMLARAPGPSADKQGCQGKDGKKGDKHGCQGKAPKQDKNACAGKAGCGGKDKQK
jgi:Spy/CpxP family protein refolding chaperone